MLLVPIVFSCNAFMNLYLQHAILTWCARMGKSEAVQDNDNVVFKAL